jgi:hypothetical protein
VWKLAAKTAMESWFARIILYKKPDIIGRWVAVLSTPD